MRFHVAVGDEDLRPQGRFGPVLVADILNAQLVEGHFMHLQIADVLAEHIGVTRLEFAAHELPGCIHMQVVERLIVDGIERGALQGRKGFVAVDELVEGKALLLRIVSIGLIEGVGAEVLFVEVAVVVVEQETLYGCAICLQTGHADLPAVLLLQ